MNTSKSLNELLQTYFQTVVKEAVEANGENIVVFAERSKKVRAKAAAAIVEAVEGLIPEVVHKDITVWGGSKDGMRFNEDRCIGYNACRDAFLQAIKEWQ